MAGAGDLINPQGKPLIPEPRYVVIKVTKGNPLPPQVVQAITQIVKCNVIVLPMDSEFLSGKLAEEEMKSMHNSIHAVMDIPLKHLTAKAYQVLYSAMKFLCEQTAPGDDSDEVNLMKRLKDVVGELEE